MKKYVSFQRSRNFEKVSHGFFKISSLVFLSLFLSLQLQAQFSNVPVTGFNEDIVADGNTNPDGTSSTSTAIDGAGWVFAAPGYYPSGAGAQCSASGFPGPTITSTNTTNNSGITYTLQSPSGNNALKLMPGISGDLTVVTPVNAAKLFLVCLSGDGACSFTAKVNFADGSNETITSSAPDWCGGAATYKITPTQYYRILRTATTCNGALCPYIYEVPLTLSSANFNKNINSITLTNTSVGSKLNVLALGRRNGFLPGLPYTVNGSASQDDCHTYTLTTAQTGRSGSVWNNNRIDLSQSFDFVFDIYLGNQDVNGADGIAFVLQPISTSIGGNGSGLGFGGINPSIGVTMDTYRNSTAPNNDPDYDHIAIQRNGDLDHLTANNLAGPVTIINGNNNAEDGNWHKLRIVWNATTKVLDAYVDGSLRVSRTEDFVTTTFSGNPLVFWGFTGSTGALFNLQRFRTALEPHWNFAPTQTLCVNQPITFNDSTISFTTLAKIIWNFGDGTYDSVNVNPTHIYTNPGTYTVIQTVRGADGCEETNTQTIIVGGNIALSSTVTDANCSTQGSVTLQLPANPTPFNVSWNSTPSQSGTSVNLDPGQYTATVLDGMGCSTTHDVTVGLINNLVFELHRDTTICKGSSFNANTNSNGTSFTWTPTDGLSSSTIASPVVSPESTTTYTVDVNLGYCDSTRTWTVTVPIVTADAGADQTITDGTATQLQGSVSGGTFSWAPPTGLSSTSVLSPTANPRDTTTYTLTVTSPEGCTATDEVTIIVKPILDCAVPMEAITPNGDGINELWLIGRQDCYVKAAVRVFNRYGHPVYESKDYKNDWDGTYKGKPLPDATYYFVIEYTLYTGRVRVQKGNLTILR